ncbi:kinesin-related protein 4-like [Watersipora subatra]|uniref:kinesin-related protein 4-like n=1 Tax=Watersipora subatra TaxID=2589382 RepID=UPI00355B7AE7
MVDRQVVAVRIRPLIKREIDSDCKIHWRKLNKEVLRTGTGVSSQGSYAFDKVIGPDEDNLAAYKAIAQDLVHGAVKGINGTIFAYGQTASGKTHTMLGSPTERGLVEYAVNELFELVAEAADRAFLVSMHYKEIYNEEVIDLLSGNQNLKIRESEDGSVYVDNVRQELVESALDFKRLLRSGDKVRHVGNTNLNERSSRSHAIATLIVESQLKGDDDGAVLVSQLNFVDLAGSEKANQTGAVGVRLKEGSRINTSLHALALCMNKLAEKSSHIPYRDSKLTRLLQNSIGGNSRTAIIASITPASVDETVSTLRFAYRAKAVSTEPIVNEVINEHTLTKRLEKRISELELQLAQKANLVGLALLLLFTVIYELSLYEWRVIIDCHCECTEQMWYRVDSEAKSVLLKELLQSAVPKEDVIAVGELFESGAGSSSFRRPSFPGNVSRRRKRQASDRVSASSFIEEEDVFMEPHKVFRLTPERPERVQEDDQEEGDSICSLQSKLSVALKHNRTLQESFEKLQKSNSALEIAKKEETVKAQILETKVKELDQQRSNDQIELERALMSVSDVDKLPLDLNTQHMDQAKLFENFKKKVAKKKQRENEMKAELEQAKARISELCGVSLKLDLIQKEKSELQERLETNLVAKEKQIKDLLCELELAQKKVLESTNVSIDYDSLKKEKEELQEQLKVSLVAKKQEMLSHLKQAPADSDCVSFVSGLLQQENTKTQEQSTSNSATKEQELNEMSSKLEQTDNIALVSENSLLDLNLLKKEHAKMQETMVAKEEQIKTLLADLKQAQSESARISLEYDSLQNKLLDTQEQLTANLTGEQERKEVSFKLERTERMEPESSNRVLDRELLENERARLQEQLEMTLVAKEQQISELLSELEHARSESASISLERDLLQKEKSEMQEQLTDLTTRDQERKEKSSKLEQTENVESGSSICLLDRELLESERTRLQEQMEMTLAAKEQQIKELLSGLEQAQAKSASISLEHRLLQKEKSEMEEQLTRDLANKQQEKTETSLKLEQVENIVSESAKRLLDHDLQEKARARLQEQMEMNLMAKEQQMKELLSSLEQARSESVNISHERDILLQEKTEIQEQLTRNLASKEQEVREMGLKLEQAENMVSGSAHSLLDDDLQKKELTGLQEQLEMNLMAKEQQINKLLSSLEQAQSESVSISHERNLLQKEKTEMQERLTKDLATKEQEMKEMSWKLERAEKMILESAKNSPTFDSLKQEKVDLQKQLELNQVESSQQRNQLMLSEEAQFQNGVGISSEVNAPTEHTENMLAIRTVNSAEKQSFKESFLQNVPSTRSESDSTEMSFACDTFHMKEFGPIKDTNASQIVQEQESVDICSDLKKVEDELGEPNEVSIRFNRSGMEKSHLMSKFAEEQITEQAEILEAAGEKLQESLAEIEDYRNKLALKENKIVVLEKDYDALYKEYKELAEFSNLEKEVYSCRTPSQIREKQLRLELVDVKRQYDAECGKLRAETKRLTEENLLIKYRLEARPSPLKAQLSPLQENSPFTEFGDVSLGSQSMPTSSITLIESPCYSESGSFTSPVKAGKLDFSESCRPSTVDIAVNTDIGFQWFELDDTILGVRKTGVAEISTFTPEDLPSSLTFPTPKRLMMEVKDEVSELRSGLQMAYDTIAKLTDRQIDYDAVQEVVRRTRAKVCGSCDASVMDCEHLRFVPSCEWKEAQEELLSQLDARCNELKEIKAAHEEQMSVLRAEQDFLVSAAQNRESVTNEQLANHNEALANLQSTHECELEKLKSAHELAVAELKLSLEEKERVSATLLEDKLKISEELVTKEETVSLLEQRLNELEGVKEAVSRMKDNVCGSCDAPVMDCEHLQFIPTCEWKTAQDELISEIAAGQKKLEEVKESHEKQLEKLRAEQELGLTRAKSPQSVTSEEQLANHNEALANLQSTHECELEKLKSAHEFAVAELKLSLEEKERVSATLLEDKLKISEELVKKEERASTLEQRLSEIEQQLACKELEIGEMTSRLREFKVIKETVCKTKENVCGSCDAPVMECEHLHFIPTSEWKTAQDKLISEIAAGQKELEEMKESHEKQLEKLRAEQELGLTSARGHQSVTTEEQLANHSEAANHNDALANLQSTHECELEKLKSAHELAVAELKLSLEEKERVSANLLEDKLKISEELVKKEESASTLEQRLSEMEQQLSSKDDELALMKMHLKEETARLEKEQQDLLFSLDALRVEHKKEILEQVRIKDTELDEFMKKALADRRQLAAKYQTSKETAERLEGEVSRLKESAAEQKAATSVSLTETPAADMEALKNQIKKEVLKPCDSHLRLLDKVKRDNGKLEMRIRSLQKTLDNPEGRIKDAQFLQQQAKDESEKYHDELVLIDDKILKFGETWLGFGNWSLDSLLEAMSAHLPQSMKEAAAASIAKNPVPKDIIEVSPRKVENPGELYPHLRARQHSKIVALESCKAGLECDISKLKKENKQLQKLHTEINELKQEHHNLKQEHKKLKDLFERTEQELYAAREKASIRPAKGQVKTLFPAPEADIHVQMKIKGLEFEKYSLSRKNNELETTLDKLREKYVVLRERYDRLQASNKGMSTTPTVLTSSGPRVMSASAINSPKKASAPSQPLNLNQDLGLDETENCKTQ